MKFTAIITFFMLSFNCKDKSSRENALIFFPDSKAEVLQAGFKLEKGIIKEHYKKEYGDTVVYFHYPSEESMYYKLIQFDFAKIDTVSFFNFVKQNQSSAEPYNIILADGKGNKRAFFLNVDRRKRFAQLLYVHPDYKKYKDKIDTIQAPESIEN